MRGYNHINLAGNLTAQKSKTLQVQSLKTASTADNFKGNRKDMNKTFKNFMVLLFFALIAAAIIMPAARAIASTSAGTGTDALPWETPLEKIVKSLTGFWAYAVIIIAFVASAGMMFFGQAEMQGWVRNLVFLIMVASFLVGGGVFAKNVLGLTGMLIP